MTPLNEKRFQLRELRSQIWQLQAEIQKEEQDAALARMDRLSPHRRLVLKALWQNHSENPVEGWCRTKRWIMGRTALSREQVSRAVRALCRLGLAKLHCGLFTDDGEAAGSGYQITEVGKTWWRKVEAPITQGELGELTP